MFIHLRHYINIIRVNHIEWAFSDVRVRREQGAGNRKPGAKLEQSDYRNALIEVQKCSDNRQGAPAVSVAGGAGITMVDDG